MDVLARIDETLTFYSAGLGEDVTVPVEVSAEATYQVWGVALGRLSQMLEHLTPVMQAYVDSVGRLLRQGGSLAALLAPEPARSVRIRRRARRAELRRVHADYVRCRRGGCVGLYVVDEVKAW